MGYDEVIVGEDQTQHLNFARDLIQRYNKQMNTDFPIPVANTAGGRVMSLIDPTSKMSKSEPNGCLFLDDAPDIVAHKIKKATADAEGRSNLYSLYQQLGGKEPLPAMNSILKDMLTEEVNAVLKGAIHAG
jgi:tryptophanyl-tRNA synthetase